MYLLYENFVLINFTDHLNVGAIYLFHFRLQADTHAQFLETAVFVNFVFIKAVSTGFNDTFFVSEV